MTAAAPQEHVVVPIVPVLMPLGQSSDSKSYDTKPGVAALTIVVESKGKMRDEEREMYLGSNPAVTQIAAAVWGVIFHPEEHDVPKGAAAPLARFMARTPTRPVPLEMLNWYETRGRL